KAPLQHFIFKLVIILAGIIIQPRTQTDLLLAARTTTWFDGSSNHFDFGAKHRPSHSVTVCVSVRNSSNRYRLVTLSTGSVMIIFIAILAVNSPIVFDLDSSIKVSI